MPLALQIAGFVDEHPAANQEMRETVAEVLAEIHMDESMKVSIAALTLEAMVAQARQGL